MATILQETWTQWQGEIINDRFLLRQYLAGDEESAVFLTDAPQGTSSVAIRLVAADSEHARLELSRWKLGAALSHRTLIRIYETGEAHLGGVPLYYAVMEHAQENLSEVLRERPLTPAEASEMIEPVVDALAYLHGKDLAHGNLNPAHIMAVNDQLKISSHGLFRAGEPHPRSQQPNVYDAPEASQGISAAGDIWSLGVTLMEALTQRPSVLEPGQDGPPLPQPVTPEVAWIARQCLERDARRRSTAAEIASRLHNSPAETVAAPAKPDDPIRLGRYAVPAVILGVALLSMAVWKFGFSRPPEQASITVVPAATPLRSDAKISAPPAAPGEVAHQVLPEAPPRIRNSIRGTVRVRVKVNVDPAGNVAGAKLDSGGGSKYFANLAVQAAKQWKFQPPRINGENTPSEWNLAFAFTRSRTSVVPRQTAPRVIAR